MDLLPPLLIVGFSDYFDLVWRLAFAGVGLQCWSDLFGFSVDFGILV